ncbi:multisubunit potassium/proton antiporter, PhaD subunit [Marinobacter daqiaonensis]|uniref:Multisubunit potassium/proton antiporter, PhaD subunit n=1 Tax=Marinobacter daqiaonensis TaxID=650891 RepID=A0A1I6HL44_9GAMM|nr:monovalent cation/H+ antiporter subunit D [Marinobacter daqiaonensis]SFR55124.1 multisubunit potassium/proton antiporter, PhaD subunit [Marinobacter daqiaonensis]
MNHWLIAPILIPLIGGFLQVFMGYAPLNLRRTLGLATTAMLVVTTFFLLMMADDGNYRAYAFGNWAPPFGIVMVLDRLAALMLFVTAVLALFAHLYSIGRTDVSSRQFHALFLFQLLGLNIAFLTGDLFNLFVAFEVLLIASYGLLLHGEGTRRTVPGLHYVVLNLVGSALFLISVGMIYSVTGTLNMADLAVTVRQLPAEDLPLVEAGGMILLVVFALKAALLPLTFWLPAAYATATAPVAALFAVMTKVGVYAIIRVYTLIFGENAGALSNLGMDWVFPLALLTMVMGMIGMIGSGGVRTLIAWQVVVSVGTILAAFALMNEAGLSSALFYLIHTTWVAGGLFLVADMIAGQRGSVEDRIVTAPRMRNRTFISVMFMLGAVAAAGLPPLSGFFAKVLIMKSAVPGVEMAALWTVILLSGFISLLAFSRAGSIVFWRNVEGHIEQPERLIFPHTVGAGALIALSVAIVVAAGPVSDYTDATAKQLRDTSAYTSILEMTMVGEE